MKMSPRLTNVARITVCTVKRVKVWKNGQQKTRNLFCSNVAKQVARYLFPIFAYLKLRTRGASMGKGLSRFLILKTSLMLESLRASRIRQTSDSN